MGDLYSKVWSEPSVFTRFPDLPVELRLRI
jgi:hypothetical protein